MSTAGNIQFTSSGHTSNDLEDWAQNMSHKVILKGQNIIFNLTALYSIILPIEDWIFQNISLCKEDKN